MTRKGLLSGSGAGQSQGHQAQIYNPQVKRGREKETWLAGVWNQRSGLWPRAVGASQGHSQTPGWYQGH